MTLTPITNRITNTSYNIPFSSPSLSKFKTLRELPQDSIMKVAKSNTETRSSKLSVNKMPAKVGKAAAKDPNKPKRPASAFFVFM
ncbi:unnamed protein product [Eruca vesicaria subsp. sativa]|uniref:Uncharacterized protein n=1 Tax=Eruca vesicaria subsp. sativa TaxID=29727 RepID=A0ABC8JV82_ERUVS|nr:unnamed protein product [Eruca vesicaria subsp. sativa]